MADQDNGINPKTSYCGRKGGWFKPPYHKFFNASCFIHDTSYTKGGDWIDRLRADQGFLRAMLADCRAIEQKLERTYYQSWCWLYYYGVRIGGKKSFNYTK